MFCFVVQQHVRAQPVEFRGVGDGSEPGDPAALLDELLVHGAAGARAARQQVAGGARGLRPAGAVSAGGVGAAAAAPAPGRRAAPRALAVPSIRPPFSPRQSAAVIDSR